MEWIEELYAAHAVRDAKWLRAFLSENGVRKPNARWDLSDEALISLGWDITNAAFRAKLFDTPAQLATIAAAVQETETRILVELLSERLEVRRAAFLELKSQSGKLSARTFVDLIAKVDAISLVLEQGGPALAPLMPGLHPCTTWRDHAVELAQAFVGWIRDCNPGHRIGISPRGPVAAYIWAVTPLVTGDRPSLDSVAGYLQEHREEILKR